MNSVGGCLRLTFCTEITSNKFQTLCYLLKSIISTEARRQMEQAAVAVTLNSVNCPIAHAAGRRTTF
jgi:hypothetical protein